MGQVVPFITRIGASCDWSDEERARLAELGERLTAAGLRVEVIYGTTEEGDPWCVVKDESEEVLIHVARIAGAFVIHHALDDTLRQGDDLPAILSERLAWEDAPGRVTPFSRRAQGLFALIIATAFFYESALCEGVGHGPAADHFDPTGHEAGHLAAQDAGAPPSEEAFVASRALHAEAMPQAATPAPPFGDSAASPVEWRSFGLADADIGRADHGGADLVLARPSPSGAAAIANLEVTAVRPAAPLVVAFDTRFADQQEPALPTVKVANTSPPAPHNPFVTARFRGSHPDHPDPATPQTADHPAPVVVHWVELDLDGRPDVRVPAPDEVRPPARPPEPVLSPVAEHEAIVAVGQGFTHAAIV